jgi:hypothetical protein
VPNWLLTSKPEGLIMTENANLMNRRDELKRQLLVGQNMTLMDKVFDETERMIRALTRMSGPVSIYASSVIILLVIVIPGLLISLLLGETERLADLGLAGIVFVGLGLAALISAKVNVGFVLASFRDHIIDAIESVENLSDLECWLADVCWNRKKNLACSVAFGILFGGIGIFLVSAMQEEFIGLALSFWVLVGTALLGIAIYFVLLMVFLPLRISRYQFKLFAAGPSRSEVIIHLSRILNRYAYVIAAFSAVLTLYFGIFFGTDKSWTWFALLVIFTGWLPVTLQFIANQTAIGKIIATAKWKTLNVVQAKIERLHEDSDLTDRETIETLNYLMDYHDRIAAARGSALGLGTGLSFFNQLLLPLLAFLLANLDKLLELLP